MASDQTMPLFSGMMVSDDRMPLYQTIQWRRIKRCHRSWERWYRMIRWDGIGLSDAFVLENDRIIWSNAISLDHPIPSFSWTMASSNANWIHHLVPSAFSAQGGIPTLYCASNTAVLTNDRFRCSIEHGYTTSCQESAGHEVVCAEKLFCANGAEGTPLAGYKGSSFLFYTF